MTIKIYSVKGMGFVVGEKKRQDNEKIYLEYPAILIPNHQTQQGVRPIMVPPIPDFFAGQFEMLKEFEIEKKDFKLSGAPSQGVLELYAQYRKGVRQLMSGIVEAGVDVMDRLPKDGKGGPVLQ